ncbi:MAG: PEP-CTERM sorting domain-containing protein [Phycisphaeraceae bacterium]|nr:PEP-CTERM sorting domain-containing protein [Phycisphaeraceae bacterium]
MATLRSRLSSHFGTVAAVAAGTVAIGVGSADAAIVHSTVNLNIPATTNGLYLNVVNGNYNVGGGGGSTVPGWDINPWSATGFGLFNPASPAGGVYVVTSPGWGANLAFGAEIGGSNSYGSGTSSNISQWNLNSDQNLIGFRFHNEDTGQVHYGWFRVAFGASITNRTLVEYAYESEAGVAILAGAVPAPGALALLGLAGLAGTRRRRA